MLPPGGGRNTMLPSLPGGASGMMSGMAGLDNRQLFIRSTNTVQDPHVFEHPSAGPGGVIASGGYSHAHSVNMQILGQQRQEHRQGPEFTQIPGQWPAQGQSLSVGQGLGQGVRQSLGHESMQGQGQGQGVEQYGMSHDQIQQLQELQQMYESKPESLSDVQLQQLQQLQRMNQIYLEEGQGRQPSYNHSGNDSPQTIYPDSISPQGYESFAHLSFNMHDGGSNQLGFSEQSVNSTANDGWNLAAPSFKAQDYIPPSGSVKGGHGQDFNVLGSHTMGGGFNTKAGRAQTLAKGELKGLGTVDPDAPDIEVSGMMVKGKDGKSYYSDQINEDMVNAKGVSMPRVKTALVKE